MNDCESVKIILQDIGYVLSDHGKEYRTRPLYRDSDNDSVLRIWKNSGQWVDFKENISGSLEDLVKITLKLKSIDEAKNWISAKVGVVHVAIPLVAITCAISTTDVYCQWVGSVVTLAIYTSKGRTHCWLGNHIDSRNA